MSELFIIGAVAFVASFIGTWLATPRRGVTGQKAETRLEAIAYDLARKKAVYVPQMTPDERDKMDKPDFKSKLGIAPSAKEQDEL